MTFSKWFQTFLDEKGVDLERVLVIPGPSGDNHMPIQIITDMILATCAAEQAAIKDMIVRIDFANGDVVGYFRHLGQAIAL